MKNFYVDYIRLIISRNSYGIHKQVLYKMITAVTAFKPKEIMRLGSFIVAICAFGCHEARC